MEHYNLTLVHFAPNENNICIILEKKLSQLKKTFIFLTLRTTLIEIENPFRKRKLETVFVLTSLIGL